jgi:DNA-binding MarR family transcriptional regulator
MVSRRVAVRRVLDQLRHITVDVDELSVATAIHLRLNRTDLRALQLLRTSTGLTAGDLARGLHVTTGATTRVIDSLVVAGHAEREWDPVDRRRIVVRLTPAARQALDSSDELLQAEAQLLLERRSSEELEALSALLGELQGLMRAHARRLVGGS